MIGVPTSFRTYAEDAARDAGVALTKHALKQMWRRQIDPWDVMRVVEDPAVKYGHAKGKGSQYMRMSGPSRSGRTLYVCTAEENLLVLISAGWRGEEN
jgi:hypothetical protein